jgi:hypothetical protein
MKSAKKIVLSLLLLAAVSLPAAAQDAYGKFTVSHETRWGTAVLPAGNYTVSLTNGPVPYVTVSSDPNKSLSIMAVAQYVDTGDCKESSLTLEQSGGDWDVRSLCFASASTVYFNVPQKPTRAVAAPQVAAVAGTN